MRLRPGRPVSATHEIFDFAAALHQSRVGFEMELRTDAEPGSLADELPLSVEASDLFRQQDWKMDILTQPGTLLATRNVGQLHQVRLAGARTPLDVKVIDAGLIVDGGVIKYRVTVEAVTKPK